MNRLITIKTDGSETVKELQSVPRLEELQKAVGGWIETVPYFNEYEAKPCVAFCNEHGKLEGLPYNYKATVLWRHLFETDDVLMGDVAIVQGEPEFMADL